MMTTPLKCKRSGCTGKGDFPFVTRIDNTSEVVFVALNRIKGGANVDGEWVVDKNEDDIEFDEILDLTNYLSVNAQNNGETARYRLSAIIMHSGEGGGAGGHYTSLVRGPTGTCYQLDDYAKAVQAGSLEELLDDSSTDFVPVVLTYVKAVPDDKKKKSGDNEDEGGSEKGKSGSGKDNEGTKGEVVERVERVADRTLNRISQGLMGKPQSQQRRYWLVDTSTTTSSRKKKS